MTDHMRLERTEGQAFAATWVVCAHWAHPRWNDYAILLYDLTTPMKQQSITFRADVTHEVTVWALDPDTTLALSHEDPVEWGKEVTSAILHPANHGYQFTAPSDDAAHGRIAEIVTMIRETHLSPDTDFSRVWDLLFSDGVSLHRQG